MQTTRRVLQSVVLTLSLACTLQMLVDAAGAMEKASPAARHTIREAALEAETQAATQVVPEHLTATRLEPEELGDLQLARGEYAAALATFRSVQPATAALNNKIGVAYSHLFALDEALKYYRQALAMKPDYAQAYNNEGTAYQGKLQYGAAVKAYKKALRINHDMPAAYRNLGIAYVSEGKYAKASDAFRKALALDPHILDNRPGELNTFGTAQQRIEIAIYLAKAFTKTRRYDAAIEELKQACSLGFKDRKRLLHDPDFAALRETPQFDRFLAEGHLEGAGA